ncbi:MAG: riboflavin synthase [Acidobacteriota bacterium]
MFTGIVQERGRVDRSPQRADGGVRLVIDHSEELSQRLEIGASLSVSGVCLTIVEMSPGQSSVDLAPETLRRTNLDQLEAGDEVNLESALRTGDALGGHWVQGHVDTTVELLEREDLEEHRELSFALPAELSPYLVEKGSVTLDGVSLTVWGVEDDRFRVALIPHTLEVTTLDSLQPGDRVNLEIDVLAKYVDRILSARGLSSGVLSS